MSRRGKESSDMIQMALALAFVPFAIIVSLLLLVVNLQSGGEAASPDAEISTAKGGEAPEGAAGQASAAPVLNEKPRDALRQTLHAEPFAEPGPKRRTPSVPRSSADLFAELRELEEQQELPAEQRRSQVASSAVLTAFTAAIVFYLLIVVPKKKRNRVTSTRSGDQRAHRRSTWDIESAKGERPSGIPLLSLLSRTSSRVASICS